MPNLFSTLAYVKSSIKNSWKDYNSATDFHKNEYFNNPTHLDPSGQTISPNSVNPSRAQIKKEYEEEFGPNPNTAVSSHDSLNSNSKNNTKQR